MNYIGKGRLIDYSAYTKNNKTRHIYSILNGSENVINGLYDACELLSVIQDTQTLKEIKAQNVTFKVIERIFNGKIYNSYTSVKSV